MALHVKMWRACCLKTLIAPQDERGKPRGADVAPQEKEGSSAITTTQIRNATSVGQQDPFHPFTVRETALVNSNEHSYFIPYILPPEPLQWNEMETTPYLSPYQGSLSPVSTLTESSVEGVMSLGESRDERTEETFARDDDGHRERGEPFATGVPLAPTKLNDTMLPIDSAGEKLTEITAWDRNPKAFSDGKSSTGSAERLEDLADRDEQPPPTRCMSDTSVRGEGVEKIGSTCRPDGDLAPHQEGLSVHSREMHPENLVHVERDIAIVGRLLFQDADQIDKENEDSTTQYDSESRSITRSSNDSMEERGVDIVTKNHVGSTVLLEEIDRVEGDACLRDIFFVPRSDGRAERERASHPDELLGLRLSDASCPVTHPRVAEVSATSPLVGSILTGDVILRVNEESVAGFKAHEVMRLLDDGSRKERREEARQDDDEQSSTISFGTLKYHMTKLTMMCSRCDDLSESDADEAADIGLPGSRAEL
jgi:hypothetical protein